MAMAEDKSKLTSVLFACTMNVVRSPMAAAMLRQLKGREIYVESAGVEAGAPDKNHAHRGRPGVVAQFTMCTGSCHEASPDSFLAICPVIVAQEHRQLLGRENRAGCLRPAAALCIISIGVPIVTLGGRRR